MWIMMNYTAKKPAVHITSGTLRILHDHSIEAINKAGEEGRGQPSQTTKVKPEHAFSLAIFPHHHRGVDSVLSDDHTAQARASKANTAGRKNCGSPLICQIISFARLQRPRQSLHGRLRTRHATGTA